MNLYSRFHTSVLPSSPYLNNTLCLWDVRTNLLEKYVHEWDKEEEREDNESERDLLPPFSLERGLGNREKTENRRSLLRRPSLILGLEEIWRGVLKSRPGFPFLSPRGDFALGIQPRFIFIRFPHRRVSISFVISRARWEHDSLRFLCSNLFLFLPSPLFSPLSLHFVFTFFTPSTRRWWWFFVLVSKINCFFFLFILSCCFD